VSDSTGTVIGLAICIIVIIIGLWGVVTYPARKKKLSAPPQATGFPTTSMHYGSEYDRMKYEKGLDGFANNLVRDYKMDSQGDYTVLRSPQEKAQQAYDQKRNPPEDYSWN